MDLPVRLFPAAIAVVLLLAAPRAEAKDLRNRLGIGFDNQFGQLSALSVRYGLPMPDPAINIEIEGAFGFVQNATTDGSYFGGGRLHYGVVAEDNMNLTLGGGAGMLSDGASQTLRIEAVMGAQFFLFGLENLGFLTEWGIHVDSGDTAGSSTAAAMGVGAHYWF
jgi:hypothetical protein